MTFTDNVASGSMASYGGARITGGSLVGEQVVFRGNLASESGGGLGASSADVDLSWTVFTDNEATNNGGGAVVANSYGLLTLTHAIVAGNRSGLVGGGLWQTGPLEGPGGLDISQAAFVDNESDRGGAIKSWGSGGPVTNVVFADNRANNIAGAIRCLGAGNTAPNVAYSAFWNNTPATFHSCPDYLSSSINIATEPGFLDVSAADPFDWDLHLAVGSDLIDAGDPNLAVRDPDTSYSDIGPFGGPGADGWDLDWDGWYSWWHPGVYDPINDLAAGRDCDDRDADTFPGGGC